MQLNKSPEQLLDRLQTELQQVSQITELSGEEFDQSHELFERSSSQQQLIREWLTELVLQHSASGEPLKILSVGCGSGILDLPLIQLIAGEAVRIEYIGVDPNSVACRRFRQEFDKLGLKNVKLELIERDIESLESEQQFDFIHAVHSLYYFADPAATIDALIQLRAPDGHLVIVQSPEAKLNQMAQCFWHRHVDNGLWFSDCLDDHLSERGFNYSRHRIHGEVNVTRCFDSSCSQGEMLLDFITQSVSKHFTDEILDLCRGYLHSISSSKEDHLFVSHPADAFVVAGNVHG
jgi:SAM-dependent methyltransferase